MKEVTTIITCEITEIMQVPDDTVIPPAHCYPPYQGLDQILKGDLDVDNVNIKLVQFFVHDLPNTDVK